MKRACFADVRVSPVSVQLARDWQQIDDVRLAAHIILIDIENGGATLDQLAEPAHHDSTAVRFSSY